MKRLLLFVGLNAALGLAVWLVPEMKAPPRPLAPPCQGAWMRNRYAVGHAVCDQDGGACACFPGELSIIVRSCTGKVDIDLADEDGMHHPLASAPLLEEEAVTCPPWWSSMHCRAPEDMPR